MRRPWVLVVLGALAGAGAVRADLVCERSPVSVGEVRSGKQVIVSFDLTNTGPAGVEVLEVKGGCGCLKPSIDQVKIAPGGKARVTVEVSTVTQAEGANTWKAGVRYRVGGAVAQEQELPLLITASVIAEVSVRPATLVLHTEGAISHEFVLTELRALPLAVKAVQTRSPHLRTSITEPRRNSQGAWERTLRLEVLASCPDGKYEDGLVVLTADPDFPELTVPFTVVKRSPQRVSALPGSVSVAGTRGLPLPARVVLLQASDEQPVEIEKVETEGPFSCTWASGPGAAATLRVLTDAARLGGDSYQGTIRVRLRSPQAQTVSIPVRCSVR